MKIDLHTLATGPSHHTLTLLEVCVLCRKTAVVDLGLSRCHFQGKRQKGKIDFQCTMQQFSETTVVLKRVSCRDLSGVRVCCVLFVLVA